MELNQKKGFQKRRITVTETGIKFYFKTPSEEGEHHFSFEELILNKVNKKKDIELTFPAVTGVIFLISIMTLIGTITSNEKGTAGYFFFAFFFCISVIFFLLHRTFGITKRIYIPLANNRKINILQDTPTEPEVEKFLEELTAKQSAFLKEKYASVSKRLPIEMQMEQINWLLDRSIITLVEFSNLRNQLIGKETANNIGFITKTPESTTVEKSKEI